MTYVVSTIWTHPAEMDKDRMREVQAQWRDNENLVNIYWFEINPTTHGSVSILPEGRVRANLAMQQAHRKASQTNQIIMTHEAQGECFAVLHG